MRRRCCGPRISAGIRRRLARWSRSGSTPGSLDGANARRKPGTRKAGGRMALRPKVPGLRERLVLSRLTPAATYRRLAAQLREAARTKSDTYARAVLNKAADNYEAFACHVEDVQRFWQSVTPQDSAASAQPAD